MKTTKQKAALWFTGLLLTGIFLFSITIGFQGMYTVGERLQIRLKWLLSLRKSEWTLADYPIRVKMNGQSPEPGIAYCAQILNWPGPVGLGATRTEAYAALAANLDEIRKHRDTMPRPGTHVAIQFASTERVERNPALLDDFIQRVLLFKKEDPVFISDVSSLGDFGDNTKVQQLVARIKDVYSVDVTDIASGSGSIADILERIGRSREPQDGGHSSSATRPSKPTP